MSDTNRQARPAAPESAWALNLGTVSGIPIRLHFTFFLLLAWLFFRDTGPSRWFSVLYVLGIFACVVLHELGHSLVAQRYGIGVSEITLYPIGGVARIEKIPGPRQELWIALAGPAVNVVIAALIYLGLQVSGGLANWRSIVMNSGHWWQNLMAANIFLFVFNMIPAFPMDGGRVLRALLALRMGEVRATEVAAGVGQFLAIALGFYGFFLPNFLLVFIAFFVFLGAGQEAMMYRRKALVEGVPVKAAMIRDFRTLPVGATLRQAADLLLETSQQDFPVVMGDEVVGVLSRQALLRGFAEHGPDSYVTGSMLREFPVAAPDADLQDIAADLQGGQNGCILVMENGRLVGLVTMENLAELLVLRQIAERTRPIT
jgi:Zn-dependent protease/CBS domain-containing protein